MRKIAIVFIVVLFGYASAGFNYETGKGFNCEQPESSQYESPILIQSSACGDSGDFSLDLQQLNSIPTVVSNQYGSYYVPYTDSKLTYNGNFVSQFITIRSPAEHVLFNETTNRAALEIQIYFVNAENNNEEAAVSFLIDAFNSSNPISSQQEASLNVIDNIEGSWNIRLDNLSNYITGKQQNNLFLNFYAYNGTGTYPADCNKTVEWFVYGNKIYTSQQVITNWENYFSTHINEFNNAEVVFAKNGAQYNNARQITGSHAVARLCYSGYFRVQLSSNSGLWFALVITLIYFIFTLSLNASPVNNPDYEEDIWTHHPIISIYRVGNDVYTKTSRSALFMITIIAISCATSFFFAGAGANADGGDIILYAFYSLPFAWVASYVVGIFLRKYYEYKLEYEKTRNDEKDNEAQKFIFLFYVWVFLAWWVGFGLTVYNISLLQSSNQSAIGWWLITVFVALIIELVVDFLVCMLASGSPGLRHWLKNKGMIYDSVCHETYLLALKRD